MNCVCVCGRWNHATTDLPGKEKNYLVGPVGKLSPRRTFCRQHVAARKTRSVRTCAARTLAGFCCRDWWERGAAAPASGGWRWSSMADVQDDISAGKLVTAAAMHSPLLVCAESARSSNPAWTTRALSRINRLVAPALLALYCMPGSQCCFAECIAMFAWRAHVCILSCGVLLMLA